MSSRNLILFVFLSAFLILIESSGYGSAPLYAGRQVDQNDNVQQQYKDHLARGDQYLAEKNYAAAMLEYEKASDLMPYEDEPRLKMQSIEATLGINELAEVKRKVELAKKQEAEALQRQQSTAGMASAGQQEKKADFDQFLKNREAQSKRDSLRKVIFDRFASQLQAAENGSDMLARSQVYRQIADAFSAVNDDEIAVNYYNKALEIEETYGDPAQVSKVYEDIASVYYSTGKFQNSINNYQKSLEIKQKEGDQSGASTVMSNMASIYETTYDYNKAIDLYEQSAKIKESLGDQPGLKDVTENLGDVYYKQKVLSNSILSYEKAVDIIQNLDMQEALGPVYNKLGVAHYEMGNYDEAEKFFKVSMQNLYDSGNKKEAAMALNNLGNLLFIDNNYDDAISYYQRSLTAKTESGYDYGIAVTLFNIGNAYRRSGNQEEALKYYQKSLGIADSLGIVSLSAKNLKALAASFEASKNFEEAAFSKARLDSIGLTSVSIEIPVTENEMDLEIEKTQEILTLLNEEALKRKDMTELEADSKTTDMFISSLNKQYMKEQHKSRLLIYLSLGLGIILLLLTAQRILKKSKRQQA